MNESGRALRRPVPAGRRVSITDALGVVRFGVLFKGIDRTGPWPTVSVALNGRIERVDARDVEPWPRIATPRRTPRGIHADERDVPAGGHRVPQPRRARSGLPSSAR